jgi:hypothetical protein
LLQGAMLQSLYSCCALAHDRGGVIHAIALKEPQLHDH